MSKRKPLGSVYEAIERDIAAIGAAHGRAGSEEVGEFLDVSRYAPLRWMDPESNSDLSLKRAGQLVSKYRVRSMAEWLADKAGCDLVEREPAEVPAISDAMAALGRSVTDLADGEVSDEDRVHLRELVSVCQALLDAKRPEEVRGARIMPLTSEGRS